MTRIVGRASDERILSWLKLRRIGTTCQTIADASGVKNPQVVQSTNSVRDADALESDENVGRFYW